MGRREVCTDFGLLLIGYVGAVRIVAFLIYCGLSPLRTLCLHLERRSMASALVPGAWFSVHVLRLRVQLHSGLVGLRMDYAHVPGSAVRLCSGSLAVEEGMLEPGEGVQRPRKIRQKRSAVEPVGSRSAGTDDEEVPLESVPCNHQRC